LTIESTGPQATVDVSEFTVRLAREVTARLAPEESSVFNEVASAWRSGVAAGRAPGGAIGFGIEAALVSAIVIEVIAASIAEALGVGVGVAKSRWWRWRTRRRGGRGAELAVAETPAVDGKIVMTAAQSARLREVSRQHGRASGLSESAADLLADAMVGAVHILDAPPPSDDADS
jgi:hypothetical protein